MLEFTSSLTILVLVALSQAAAAATTSKEDGRLRFDIKRWSRSEPATAQSGARTQLQVMRHFLDDFYISVYVGTPYQEMRVAFSGYSDTWFVSNDCQTEQCKNHMKYDHASSTTYKRNGTAAVGDKLDYSGYLSTDDILIGSLVVPGFTFGEAKDTGKKNTSVDGYIGIGPVDKSASSHTDHFMYRMIKQGIAAEPKISIHIRESGLEGEEDDDEMCGTIMFGGVDESHYRGNITYSKNIYKEGFTSWLFNIGGMSPYAASSDDTELVNMSPNGSQMTIGEFDLFTYGPPEEVRALNAKLGAMPLTGSKFFYFGDCGEAGKPNVTFIVEGRNMVIRPKNYMQWTTYNSREVCISAFASGSLDSPWVLGTKIMTSLLVVLDYGAQQVGFVESM